jgi:hypothetical protein
LHFGRRIKDLNLFGCLEFLTPLSHALVSKLRTIRSLMYKFLFVGSFDDLVFNFSFDKCMIDSFHHKFDLELINLVILRARGHIF